MFIKLIRWWSHKVKRVDILYKQGIWFAAIIYKLFYPVKNIHWFNQLVQNLFYKYAFITLNEDKYKWGMLDWLFLAIVLVNICYSDPSMFSLYKLVMGKCEVVTCSIWGYSISRVSIAYKARLVMNFQINDVSEIINSNLKHINR